MSTYSGDQPPYHCPSVVQPTFILGTNLLSQLLQHILHLQISVLDQGVLPYSRRSATKRSARMKLARDKQHLSRKPSRYTVKTASTPCIDHRNILVTNVELNHKIITRSVTTPEQCIFGRPKNDHTPARLGWFSPGIFPVEVAEEKYQRTQQPAAKTGQLKANPNLAAPPGGPGLPPRATGDCG